MSRPLIEVMDELPGVDQFYVANKDDDYHYIWMNKKADNIERMKMLYGYEIVGDKDKASALVPPNAVGERVNGDVILARIPKARYEKIQKLRKQKAAAQIEIANEQFKQAATDAGFPVDETTNVTSEVLRKK